MKRLYYHLYLMSLFAIISQYYHLDSLSLSTIISVYYIISDGSVAVYHQLRLLSFLFHYQAHIQTFQWWAVSRKREHCIMCDTTLYPILGNFCTSTLLLYTFWCAILVCNVISHSCEVSWRGLVGEKLEVQLIYIT